MRSGSRLHRIWLFTIEASISIEIWGRGTDKREIWLEIPRSIWRPYCWLRRRHEDYYGECIYCHKPITDSPYYRRRAGEGPSMSPSHRSTPAGASRTRARSGAFCGRTGDVDREPGGRGSR